MEKWEIWNAYVSYEEDENVLKERPVLVYNVVSDDNIIAFKMTSHIARSDRECEVRRWAEAGLNKQTVIRTDKILRLTKNHFTCKRGKLQSIDIYRFEQCRTKY